MLVTFLYIGILTLVLRQLRSGNHGTGISPMLKKIKQWQDLYALAPAQLSSFTVGQGAEPFKLFLQALFKARPIEKSLLGFCELLEHAASSYRMQQHFFWAYRIRCFLVLGLAILGRLGFTAVHPWAPGVGLPWVWLALDLFFLGLSLAVLDLGLKILLGRAPGDWFWEGGFTTRARIWLDVEFLGVVPQEEGLAKTWRSLELKELGTGLDGTAAKQVHLDLWVKEQRKQQEIQQRSFEDILPFFELVGLGIPALLVLAVPAYHFFPFFEASL